MPVLLSAPAHAAVGPPTSEEQRALARAVETGQRVEVVGARTEFATTYANPDGSTFRLEQSVVPVRVKSPGGSWAKPDATLEKRADGTVAPKAAAVDLTFSGGGDGTGLVKIAREGRTLALGWPGRLPEPTLDGNSAVYANVLPDIDLRMTATVEGFREVLVVKTPKAASNPELKKITFSAKPTRLQLSPTEGGGMTAVDANATEVFSAPPAMMWDSSGKKSPAVGAAASARAATTKATAQGDRAAGPVPGDETADLRIQVGQNAISLAPDAKMLKETDASAFPLYIDPTVSWGEDERTLLRSDGYRFYNFDNQDEGGGERGKGVGKCGTWGGYYCGPGYVQRLYYEFSPANLAGKHILGATFRVTEPWAFQCDPRWVDLVRTNNISSSTAWSSRPGELDLMVDKNVSAGRGSLCDPDSPDAPIDFTDNAAETNENLTATVRDFAAGKFARLTLMLRAHDEGDTSAWKRFKNDGTLVVDYVGKPNYPTPFGFVAGTGVSCSPKIDAPGTISDPTPQLSATARTVVGGSPEAQLRVRFQVQKQTGTTWTALPDFMSPTSGYLGTGQVTRPSVPQALEEGPLYRVQAWTRSYWNNFGNWLTSPGSVACYFKVDKTAPKAPTVTINSTYTPCTTTACAPGGGPGKAGSFTFSPATGDANNVGYEYKQSNETVWRTPKNTGATVTETITPQLPGTYQLEVRAKDNVGVGRPGASQVVSFLVQEGPGPVGRWHFDEDSGQAIDSSTADAANQDNATLSAGAVRDDRGRRGELSYDAQGNPLATPKQDKGLQLDGATGYAATSGPVLETRSSYTVSAWVRLNPSVTKTVTALSQQSSTSSPWGHQYSAFIVSHGTAGWSMRVMSTSSVGGSIMQEIKPKQPAPKGVWTHVAALHDVAAHKASLYVNGQLQGTADTGTAWNADGPLQIGRLMYNDVYVDHFAGSIDEVAVWQRALEPEEVAREARTLSGTSGLPDVELVGSWNAEGASGTVVADTTSGYGRTMSLAGGATLDGESIVLNGSDGAATTAGPVVDDSGSFTVTTTVQLDKATLLTKQAGYVGQVVGQRTADGSSWGLWFELTGTKTEVDDDGNEHTVPVGYWRFGRVNKDGTSTWVTSDEEAALGSPVRLTGIYDALSEGGPVIRLYVGLAQNDSDKAYTALVGSGDLAVGKGYSSTAWGHFLPARIGEVRLWAGAMAGKDQIKAVIGD
ncbi:LamG domain-containing protein [Streptomyces sp.]|uniref:LamG domain-containing protein n=1 Tax=Streptomyces sp. TaxID=1931 RepID=UPI002D78783E|nr:LamG domain-containing protein [Streptomyces sp.]HET6354888.1 LamG domain-containing protein [Streptomyces sp.]